MNAGCTRIHRVMHRWVFRSLNLPALCTEATVVSKRFK
jgi:hypothetical protein